MYVCGKISINQFSARQWEQCDVFLEQLKLSLIKILTPSQCLTFMLTHFTFYNA